MSLKRRFMQLDVFSHLPMKGNPLAVVIDGDGLDDETMRAFARWTNLSETTFLLTPTTPNADYRVRIFTPRQELPFAGHPSVGSAFAAIEAGRVAAGKSRLIQQCAAGLLPVAVEGSGSQRIIHVQAPAMRLQAVSTDIHHAIARALGLPAAEVHVRLVDIGPRWWVCDLGKASRVRALDPALDVIRTLCEQHQAIGVGVFGHEDSGPAQMAVRAFCPADGIPEDPVTGSLNAAIMAVVAADGDERYGFAYLASQGREIGRDGYVSVRRDPATGAITIGGQCAPVIRGELGLAGTG